MILQFPDHEFFVDFFRQRSCKLLEQNPVTHEVNFT